MGASMAIVLFGLFVLSGLTLLKVINRLWTSTSKRPAQAELELTRP